LQVHIRRGDCYEINFCQKFYAAEIDIDPGAVFSALSRFSPNPFSAFYKNGSRYLLCASPERYIKKTGREILSQPIKGTLYRALGDKEKDQLQIEKLLSSCKERVQKT
jgi:para-aminobenzoate synthetase component I